MTMNLIKNGHIQAWRHFAVLQFVEGGDGNA